MKKYIRPALLIILGFVVGAVWASMSSVSKEEAYKNLLSTQEKRIENLKEQQKASDNLESRYEEIQTEYKNYITVVESDLETCRSRAEWIAPDLLDTL